MQAMLDVFFRNIVVVIRFFANAVREYEMADIIFAHLTYMDSFALY